MTLGINVVIILIYNNVGLLKGVGTKAALQHGGSLLLFFLQTEHYLSMPMRSESWWSSHGFFCYQTCGGSSSHDGTNNNNNNNDNGWTSGDVLLLTDGTLLSAEEDESTVIYGSGEQVATRTCFITYPVSTTNCCI